MFSFERIFRWSVIMTALMSFTALAASGAVHPLVNLAAYALIVLSGFRDRLIWRPGAWFWTPASALALGAAILALVRLQDLSDVLVYFVTYLLVNKCWTSERSRDYTWLFAICFFVVVFATFFTSAMFLMFVFAGFVVSFTLALMLHSCKDEIDRAKKVGATLSGGRYGRGEAILSKGYIASCMAISMGVLFTTALIFPLVPRTEKDHPLTRALRRNTSVLSGFSEHVNLGSISSIQLDPTIVMRVRARDHAAEEYFQTRGVRLRGLSLRYFNGRSWRNSTWSGGILMKTSQAKFPRPGYRTPRVVTARIFVDEQFSDFLFAPVTPISFNLPHARALLVNESQQFVRLHEGPIENYSYETVSMIEPDVRQARLSEAEQAQILLPSPEPDWGPSPFDRRRYVPPSVGGVTTMRSPRRLGRYLRVPSAIADDPRYMELIERWSPGENEDFELAEKVRNFLRLNYKYTLEFGNYRAEEPVLNFLLISKKGHCELYATSMVLILRSLGVPARLVNGFLSDEYNPVTQHYIVRQEHAHSWAEVWIKGYGWKTYDPTPALTTSGGERAISRLGLMFFNYYEALRFRWYRYVVDYGQAEQMTFYSKLKRAWRRVVKWTEELLAPIILAFSFTADSSVARVVILWLITAALCVLLAFLTRRYILQARRAAARPYAIVNVTPAAIALIEIYETILRRLDRLGFRRPQSQTLAEYADRVADSAPDLARFTDMTRTYYHARYGGVMLSDDEKSAMRQFAELLRQRHRRPERT